jgi:hypothetical protein
MVGSCIAPQPSDAATGLPRQIHLQALPAMDFRVAPNLASFSTSVGESPGCPDSSLLQMHLSMSLRVTPDSASSGCPKVETSSLLRTSLLWRRRRRIFELPRISCPSARPASSLQVALNPLLQLRLRCDFGLPRNLHLPALPTVKLRVAPKLRTLARQSTGLRLGSNLAPFGSASGDSPGCPEFSPSSGS